MSERRPEDDSLPWPDPPEVTPLRVERDVKISAEALAKASEYEARLRDLRSTSPKGAAAKVREPRWAWTIHYEKGAHYREPVGVSCQGGEPQPSYMEELLDLVRLARREMLTEARPDAYNEGVVAERREVVRRVLEILNEVRDKEPALAGKAALKKGWERIQRDLGEGTE